MVVAAFLAVSAAYLFYLSSGDYLLCRSRAATYLRRSHHRRIIVDRVVTRLLRNGSILARAGWLLTTTGAVLGIVLIKTGTPRAQWNWLYFHIVISVIGVGLLLADNLGSRGWLGFLHRRCVSARAPVLLIVIAGVGYGSRNIRESWQMRNRIQNPTMPPDNMGARGRRSRRRVLSQFRAGLRKAENSQQVFHGVRLLQALPRRYLQPVVQLGAPFFFQFNNQWYRKSIEYMQDTIGTTPSKWCGGCHDPAVL